MPACLILDNDELIALYLAETLKDGTKAEFIQALNDVARAKGMNEIAQKSGIQRESRSNRTHKP